MAKINIDVPKSIKSALEAKAKATGVSQSAHVRIALANYLKRVRK